MFQNQFQQPNINPNNFNPLQYMQEFIGFVNKFKNTPSQQNPEMMGRQLLQSGRMPQQIYNAIYPFANIFFNFLQKR